MPDFDDPQRDCDPSQPHNPSREDAFIAGAEWEAERSRERIAQLEVALERISVWGCHHDANFARDELAKIRRLPSPPVDTEGEAK